MTLPNFLLVGAAKAGTTTLYRCLVQHPEIYMPKLKEPLFLLDANIPSIKTLADYRKLFANSENAKAIGEASTAYLYASESPGRIRETLGEIKILISLRNPVDMAYSLWGWMTNRYGFEKLPFKEALAVEDARMNDPGFCSDIVEWPPNFYYFHRGLYHDQVKRYLDEFGAERVKVIIFEELIKDTLGHCREVYRFLGVDEGFTPELEMQHSSSVPRSRAVQTFLANPPAFITKAYNGLPLKLRLAVYDAVKAVYRSNMKIQSRPPLDPGLREELAARFMPDILKLEKLLGRDLSVWYAKKSEE